MQLQTTLLLSLTLLASQQVLANAVMKLQQGEARAITSSSTITASRQMALLNFRAC